jgi:hypothetical protein
VVRCLTATASDDSGGRNVEWFWENGDGELAYVTWSNLPGPNSTDVIDLRFVLQAGETFGGTNRSTPSAYLSASGYLLSLP